MLNLLQIKQVLVGKKIYYQKPIESIGNAVTVCFALLKFQGRAQKIWFSNPNLPNKCEVSHWDLFRIKTTFKL